MRFFLPLCSILMLAACLASFSVLWGWAEYTEPGPAPEARQVMIDKGQGLAVIADRLKEQGLITNPNLFKVAAKLSGKDKRLQAGEYDIASRASMRDILEKLVRGDVVQRRVTVREGLTSWQVVKILRETESLSGDVATIPAEGTLLPDTYQYTRNESRQDLIDRMKKAMTDQVASLWAARRPDIVVKTPEEAIVLASIVEKETGVAGERARIAGVFENRLRRGIPLQTDPTVIYALTKGEIQDDGQGPLGRRLLTKDLDTDSPYNTYKNAGLPPGPICNPGLESVRAVLNPEPHDFLYFVADGTGGHVFSRTLEEHNSNVAKWRTIRKKLAQ